MARYHRYDNQYSPYNSYVDIGFHDFLGILKSQVFLDLYRRLYILE